jgi:Pyridoxal phosphate biosynthesis protein
MFSSIMSSQASVNESKTNEKTNKEQRSKDQSPADNLQKKQLGSIPEKNNSKNRKLEELREKNLKELKELLDTEEKIEMEREKTYQDTLVPEEKEKLDKFFGIERAKASKRIKSAAKKHKKAEKALAEKLGLIC